MKPQWVGVYLTRSQSWFRRLVLIAILGMSIGSFSALAIGAVFQGFEKLLINLFSSTDPILWVFPPKGQLHPVDLPHKFRQAQILACGVREEAALLQATQRPWVATLRGVENVFFNYTRLSENLLWKTSTTSETPIWLGAGVAYKLGILEAPRTKLEAYRLPTQLAEALSPEALPSQTLKVTGIFSVHKLYDESWVILPDSFVFALWGKGYSSIEIYTPVSPSQIYALCPTCEVQDAKQKHADLYMLLRQEARFAQVALFFILGLLGLNVWTTLMAFWLYKKRDWALSMALGLTPNRLAHFFYAFTASLLGISFFIGSFAATLAVWAQQKTQWLKLQGESFVIQALPAELSVEIFMSLIVFLCLMGFFYAFWIQRIIRSASVHTMLQND
ncbi:MAG: hypothetical protein ACUVRD_05730 [Bacteroidia bacterium]